MVCGTLAIVGVGLIGGSAGLAARRRGAAARIIGVARSQDALDRAAALGAIDEGTFDLDAAARVADLVLVCTPVDRIAAQVRAAAAVARPGTLLTDAGSTKAVLVAELDGALPAGVAFVGGHPLAGSEKRGVEHARADLFDSRLVVLTPTPRTDPNAIQRVTAFWQRLGARVQTMDPRAHDEALALTSHLPHLIAAALAATLPEGLRDLTATGFRDTTRLAAGDPALWAAIFAANRDPVRRAVAAFRDRLGDFIAALHSGDAAEIERLLAHAKAVRDQLGGK